MANTLSSQSLNPLTVENGSMPAQQAKGILSQKYGSSVNGILKKHAAAEMDWGFQKLPPGISNGRAMLTEFTFGKVEAGKKNAGEVYYRASGTVLEPYSIIDDDGIEVVVRGGTTSIFGMLCDTKDAKGKIVSTGEENFGKMMMHMRRLGAEFSPEPTTDEIENTAEVLKTCMESDVNGVMVKHGPYFKFSTTKSKVQIDPATLKPKVDPNTSKPYPAGTYENWFGIQGLDNYSPPDGATAGVVDNTVDSISTPVSTQPSVNGASSSHQQTNVEVVDSNGKPPFDELDDLLEKINTSDSNEAKTALTNLAAKAGLNTDKGGPVDMADIWADVVDMIRNALNVTQEVVAEVAVPEKWKPELKKLYQFKPTILGPNKKPVVAKRAIDCEAVAINEANETVDLRSMVDTKVIYKNVGWSAIKP